MRRLCGLLVLALGLSSCATLEDRVQAMEARGVQSCIYVIAFPYPFAVVRTISATGGASIDDCKAMQ